MVTKAEILRALWGRGNERFDSDYVDAHQADQLARRIEAEGIDPELPEGQFILDVADGIPADTRLHVQAEKSADCVTINAVVDVADYITTHRFDGRTIEGTILGDLGKYLGPVLMGAVGARVDVRLPLEAGITYPVLRQ